jgi:hypothetical protein
VNLTFLSFKIYHSKSSLELNFTPIFIFILVTVNFLLIVVLFHLLIINLAQPIVITILKPANSHAESCFELVFLIKFIRIN